VKRVPFILKKISRITKSDRRKMMTADIETILFDLDGTLYQDDRFYHDYLRCAMENTRFERDIARVTRFVEAVLRGEYISLNRFYRLDIAPVGRVEALPEVLRESLLANAAPADMLRTAPKDACYLGDTWALMQIVANAMGLTGNGRGDEVYIKTRACMEQNGLAPSTELIAAIKALRPKYRTALFSNSYPATGEAFLSALGFSGVFNCTVYSAQKPYRLLEKLDEYLPGALTRPDKLLSIGDHVFNDLYPVKAIGGMAVWINPYTFEEKPAECDMMLRTTGELAQFLSELARDGCAPLTTQPKKKGEMYEKFKNLA
jgi:FMN phosphatase YigB (HAD superfamily)